MWGLPALFGRLAAFQMLQHNQITGAQNTQKRNEQALQRKLDAVADGLADLMEHFAAEDPERRAAKEDLSGDIEDLRAAVGLEGEM